MLGTSNSGKGTSCEHLSHEKKSWFSSASRSFSWHLWVYFMQRDEFLSAWLATEASEWVGFKESLVQPIYRQKTLNFKVSSTMCALAPMRNWCIAKFLEHTVGFKMKVFSCWKKKRCSLYFYAVIIFNGIVDWKCRKEKIVFRVRSSGWVPQCREWDVHLLPLPAASAFWAVSFIGSDPTVAGAGRHFCNEWHLNFCGSDWARSWHGSVSQRGQSRAL